MFGLSSVMQFRVATLLLAAALAGISVWTSLPQWAHASIDRLPVSATEAHAGAAQRASLRWAARTAGFRGDLWAKFAFSYSALLWRNAQEEGDARAVAADARAVTQKALAYAPYDPGLWLLEA